VRPIHLPWPFSASFCWYVNHIFLAPLIEIEAVFGPVPESDTDGFCVVISPSYAKKDEKLNGGLLSGGRKPAQN
jgi:hypothetical protein